MAARSLLCSGVFNIQYFFAKVLCKVFQILHCLAYAAAGCVVAGIKFLDISFDVCDCFLDGIKNFAHKSVRKVC